MKRVFFSAIALVIIMGSTISPSKSGNIAAKAENVMEFNMLDEKSEKCSYGVDQDGEVVEVLAFHSAERCDNCRAVEQLTREVVEQDFSTEYQSGRLRMSVIDITTKCGEPLADRYNVTVSSLYVNKWSDGTESRNDMTEQLFAQAVTSPEGFKSQLRSKIAELLS